MTGYERFKWLVRRISHGLAYAGMFFLVPMMLITSTEVVGRAVWGTPFPGTLELSSYMLAVFILLGVAFTQQVKGNVQVTMFTSQLPKKVALVLELFTTLLCLFIVAILAWQGLVVGLEETAVSDMLRIPQLPFKLLVPVAAGFLWLELLIDLIETAGRLKRS